MRRILFSASWPGAFGQVSVCGVSGVGLVEQSGPKRSDQRLFATDVSSGGWLSATWQFGSGQIALIEGDQCRNSERLNAARRNAGRDLRDSRAPNSVGPRQVPGATFCRRPTPEIRGDRFMVDKHPSLAWRKSSASAQGNCVEVAVDGDRVLLRDTKDQGAGAVLTFTEAEWQAFLT